MNRLAVATIFLIVPTVGVAETPVEYERDIKPLLARKCVSCHGPLKQRSKLRLDTAANMRKGGSSGVAVVPGDDKASLLVQVLTGEAGFRMPPSGTPMQHDEIGLIRRWIREGAKAPEDETTTSHWKDHWAYRPPVRPEIPDVKNKEWAANPIDAFVAQAHEQQALTPNQPANKTLLLRRVYLDLIGLPPTVEQTRAFLADTSSGAYERVVDRLLDSPQHGERWARHWMDVWRYSDWYGRRASNEIRYSQYHIWRWRDWIVDSLNEDKSYERMIHEMLAGDELDPANSDVLRATGFLGRNWYKFDRDVWLRETVEHTAMGFLSMTLKCARCHDHKYDPISQKDYYRFRAFFEPHEVRLDPVTAELDPAKQGLARVYDAHPKTPTYLFERGDDRYPDKDHPLEPGVPDSLGASALEISPVNLPVEAWYPNLRSDHVKSRMSYLREAVSKAKAGGDDGHSLSVAEAELHSFEARVKAERAKHFGTEEDKLSTLVSAASKTERELACRKAELDLWNKQQALAKLKASAKPTPAAVEKAQAQVRAAELVSSQAKTKLETTSTEYTTLGKTYPTTSTGRRLALANWITNEKNPRTARVAVNHIWRWHFGSPLVASVSNFGLSGQAPTHPELLDWLAVELMENGWKMKHLHRLIVTSRTYRLASSERGSMEANVHVDPQNRLLWRANWKRMEAEVVRDSLLHLASSLDLSMGGEDLDAKTGLTSTRRSLYFRTTPDDKSLFLELFDLANPNECYFRQESVVPQQALALLNSPLAEKQAAVLAQRWTDIASNGQFVETAFLHLLGRKPDAVEKERCERFLTEQEELGSPRTRANLLHVLFNHNDFVTIR